MNCTFVDVIKIGAKVNESAACPVEFPCFRKK